MASVLEAKDAEYPEPLILMSVTEIDTDYDGLSTDRLLDNGVIL